MTTEPSIKGPHHLPIQPAISPRIERPNQADADIDLQLVKQTKIQIRALVQEIAELAQSACAVEDFYEGFLTRTTSALASVGGAIWMLNPLSEQAELHFHVNLNQTNLQTDAGAQKQHALLINKLLAAGQPTLVSPDSGSNDPDQPANPTQYLLIVGPLIVDRTTVGIVEIFQRPGAGPTTQRGYLRFLTQMSEIASDYLRNQRLRSFREQQQLWQNLENFIDRAHRGLDTRQTAYTIANEGRRLIDCDRLSVALSRGRKCEVVAVSGLDTIQRRADQIKSLGSLATCVVRSQSPLWYAGDDSDLPPQIERLIHHYVDKSHTKMLAIIPLLKTDDEQSLPATGGAAAAASGNRPLGALIVEQLQDRSITPALEQRIEVVARHSQAALANAIAHNNIFLMPLWRTLGNLTAPFRGRHITRTIIGVAALVLIGCALCYYPYPFALSAKGQLTPEFQHQVFAQVDGILQEILVADGDQTMVQRNQLLARMSNNDLMVEIQNLEGQLNQTKEQIKKLERARYNQLSTLDDIMLDGELLKSMEAEKSLRRELEIKREHAARLDIYSPANGQVVNWQVRQHLLRRPVVRGQNLMTIIDPNTLWQLELEMPERRVAHLIKASRESETPLTVTFAIASHPGHEFTGQLISIDRKLEVYSDDGNAARVQVAFDNDQIERTLLKSGTRVTAKIHCGQRPLGYALFHELIETTQTRFLFWF